MTLEEFDEGYYYDVLLRWNHLGKIFRCYSTSSTSYELIEQLDDDKEGYCSFVTRDNWAIEDFEFVEDAETIAKKRNKFLKDNGWENSKAYNDYHRKERLKVERGLK